MARRDKAARAAAAAKAKKDGKKKKESSTAERNSAEDDASGDRKRHAIVLYESNETKARKVAVRHSAKDRSTLAPTQCTWTDEEIDEDMLPFCCVVCHCSDEIKQFIPDDDQYIWPDSSGNTLQYVFFSKCGSLLILLLSFIRFDLVFWGKKKA
jgi:hypothetical protein